MTWRNRVKGSKSEPGELLDQLLEHGSHEAPVIDRGALIVGYDADAYETF